MKYIRTTNGIYERELAVVSVCDNKEVSVIRYDKLEIEPIVKQADTIEELCDEVVVVWKDTIKDTPYVISFYYAKTAQELMQMAADNMFREIEYIKECYTAIWTDTGLKYIAKMNDKGELELL